MASTTTPTAGKKIIVGCDGTWLNSDVGWAPSQFFPWGTSSSGRNVAASNITRIVRALTPAHTSGKPQLICYVDGIGSANNWYNHFVDGSLGSGVGDHIREGYGYIRANYEPGDEIYLFGFSRGAFIARSIAALIRDVGLLTNKAMEHWPEIYADWEHLNYANRQNAWFTDKNVTFTGSNTYRQALIDANMTRPDIAIEVVGCFDTVGSLGVPVLSNWKASKSYAFVNTSVPSNAKNCFHAMALDEFRKPFTATLWENPDPSSHVNLRQCWFVGQHGNIGGSCDDAGLSNISLAWMTNLLLPHLTFDERYLEWCHEINTIYYGKNVRRWAEGHIYLTPAGAMKLGGRHIREPGTTTRADPMTGAKTHDRLVNTNETVHPSVRIRRARKGKGVDDKGVYTPSALDGFELVNGKNGDGVDDPQSSGWVWEKVDPVTGKSIQLAEEPLGPMEETLLNAS